MTQKEIAERVKGRRRDLGLTQAELADLAECSKPSVIALEKGKETLRLDTLMGILKVLGLEVIVAPRERSE